MGRAWEPGRDGKHMRPASQAAGEHSHASFPRFRMRQTTYLLLCGQLLLGEVLGLRLGGLGGRLGHSLGLGHCPELLGTVRGRNEGKDDENSSKELFRLIIRPCMRWRGPLVRLAGRWHAAREGPGRGLHGRACACPLPPKPLGPVRARLPRPGASCTFPPPSPPAPCSEAKS